MSSGDDNMRRAARTLAEVAHSLAAADHFEERLRTTLALLGQMVPYECCALLEVMPKSGRRDLYTVPDLSWDEQTVLRSRLTALLRMMADDHENGHAAAEESGVAGPEAPSTEAAGNRMHLAIPVIGLNQIIGVLFVEQSSEPFDEPYDEHSLRLLSVVAAQLGGYLTTLRLREEELEHARQLGIALRRLEETDRQKDDFLALLGHELRNPLGAINTALRVMDVKRGDDVARYHQLIDRQIRHLSRIVDDLLDASRVRLGKVTIAREVVDLRTVAIRWFETFGKSASVQSHDVQLRTANEPVFIEGDPIRLEQVLSNLMTNALKYTPAGKQIQMSVDADGEHALLSVRDDGIGMTEDVIGTAFELFTQADDSLSRSQGGLGLGLPLVRSLVQKHGGTVEAFSEGVGKGSLFVVRLPRRTNIEAAPLPPPTEPPMSRRAEQPLRIVIVEDHDDAREVLGEMLRTWGHEVSGAVDGLQAVALAMSDSPDVMLIDIGLPRLDGYEVARRIRSQLRESCPVLYAMTGYGQPEDRRRAIDAGFDAHMVKPVHAAELQQRLLNIVPQPRPKERR